MHYEDALNLLRKEVLTPNRQRLQRASERQERAQRLAWSSNTYAYGHGGLYFTEKGYFKDKNQIVGLNLHYYSYDNPAIKNTYALAQIDTLRELYITIPLKQELVEGLGSLRQLEKLELSFWYPYPFKGWAKFSFQALAGLQNLTHFVCRGQHLNDLSGIEHWKKIEYLNLSNNNIRDISPLSALTKLRELYLSNNLIEDLSPMQHYKDFIVFGYSKNPLHQLPPLRIIADVFTNGRYARGYNEAERLLWEEQQEELQKIWQLLRSKVADNIALGKVLLSSLGWSDAWLIRLGSVAEDVG